FFLITRRHPPSSPLFPYTTLFRSNGDAVGTGARPWAIMVNPSLSPAATTMAEHREARKSQRVPSPSTAALAENLVSEARMSDSPDRKSTRLNSSHVKISYAVFCLK